MNIQRYTMPVIIAAGLHGALFLLTPDTPAADITPPEAPVVLKEIPLSSEPEVREPEPSQDAEPASSSAAAKSLPSIPDPVTLPKDSETFTVPVAHHAPSFDPVKTLEGYTGAPTGLPNGPGGGFGPVGIRTVDQLDRPPRAVVQTAPGYPDNMRRDGINGSVTVRFVVGLNGEVVSAEAVKWSHREFVDPAVRAVLRWRFQPGTADGRKVSFRMAVPIEFNAARE